MLRGIAMEAKQKTGSGGPLRRAAPEIGLQNPTRRNNSVAALQSAYGNQALLRFLNSSKETPSVQNAETPVLQRKCACGGAGDGECAECKKKEESGLRRSARAGAGAVTGVPPIVHEVLQSPGRQLDRMTRAFMEPRFGRDFGNVRLHSDPRAAQSADAVNALAYTVGRDIVFARNQYAPETPSGQRLLAHELAHVVQQNTNGVMPARGIGRSDDAYEREAEAVSQSIGGGAAIRTSGQPGSAGVLQRTPANKVSCAPGPLTLPDGTVIDDPVAVITAAENRANELLNQAISELDFTRQQILGGAVIGWPTISDALGLGLQLMGLDPNSERVWKQTGGVGNYTAALLLRRLRLIRSVIGGGGFFFTCLGPRNGTIGTCVSAPICDGNAEAVSCAGSFLIDFCDFFWRHDLENQAATIIHESAHNFAEFIGAHGEVGRGEGIAECYARFAQVVGASDIANQRTDLCPDPT